MTNDRAARPEAGDVDPPVPTHQSWTWPPHAQPQPAPPFPVGAQPTPPGWQPQHGHPYLVQQNPHGPQPGYQQPYAPPPYPAPVPDPAAFPKAIGAAGVWAAVQLVLFFAVTGGYRADEMLGRVVVDIVVAALVTWGISRRRHWAFWIVLLVAFLPYLVLAVVTGHR